MNCQSTYLDARHNANCGSRLNKKGPEVRAKGRSGIESPAPALQPAFEKENRNGN
jgi:hypothetical protein